MKRLVAVIIVSIAVMILMPGCGVEPVEQAGGDDFPNAIASAGKSIAANLDQQWENPAAVSVDPLTVIEDAAVPAMPMDFLLGKRLALQNRAVYDSIWFGIDIIRGLFTVYSRKITDTTVRNDTVVLKINGGDTLIISIAGSSVRTKAPYTVELYRYTDFDGDSVLLDFSAGKQRAIGFYQRQYPGGRIETGTLAVDAGSDGNFDSTADNRVIDVSALVTLADDTVYFARVRDADGDGFILDNAAEDDSGLIDVMIQSGRANAAALIQSSICSRMVIFPADSLKNYAIRYSVTNQFAARTVRWIIRTPDGDSTFLPGDTVNVLRATQPLLDGDSLDTDTLVLRAILGDNPRDSLDDALAGIYLHSKFLRGNDREIYFSYDAATPLLNGQKPHDGTVHIKAIFSDESWIEAEGTIDGTTISAEVMTSGGKRYAVTWDAEGNVLTVTAL